MAMVRHCVSYTTWSNYYKAWVEQQKVFDRPAARRLTAEGARRIIRRAIADTPVSKKYDDHGDIVEYGRYADTHEADLRVNVIRIETFILN